MTKQTMKMYKLISLIILMAFVLNSCETPPSGKFNKEEIISTLKERSTLELSDKFQILEDTTIHTQSAFNSNSTLQLRLSFDEQTINLQIPPQLSRPGVLA